MFVYYPSVVDAVTCIVCVPTMLSDPLKVREPGSKLSPAGNEAEPCSTAFTVIVLLRMEQNGPTEKDIAPF